MASVLDRAKANLVYRHPFFASILMRRPLIEDNTIPTAAVDQRGNIYYNKQFVESLNLEQAIFLLCHEVMHVVGQHFSRLHTRDRERWNIATDAWINDLLQHEKVGQFIPGCVDMKGSKDELVDDIYNKLPQSQQYQQGQGKGKGQKGQYQGQGNAGATGGDLIERGQPMSDEEAQAVGADTKIAVAQAAQAAKMQGKLPGAIADLVADMLASKVPWHDVLERFMVGFTKSDPSWKRPNRRFKEYLPSTGKLPAMGKVVIQIDVSGSISKVELDHYNGHMQRIIELCRPEQVDVIYVDTRVAKHQTFGPDEEVKLEFYSGGGTDMEAGFDWVERQGLDPDVIVCLTDGYTGFTQPPQTPVVWVCSTQQPIPYGEVVRFNTTD